MPNFTAGTSFSDGVTNDVTAAKLNALVADAVPTSNLALTSTNGTIANFTSSTANITLGTIPTLTAGTTTSTNDVVTNGTITNLSATTSTFLGTITGSTNVINIGSGQIYKDASGNVGIGTSSPSQKLDIQNASASVQIKSTTATNSAILKIENNSTAYIGNETSSGNNTFLGTTAYATCLGNTGAYPVQLATNNNVRMTIDSSGNVGIGETSILGRLSVKGSTATSSSFSVYVTDSAGSAEFFVRDDGLIGTGVLANSPYNFTTANAANCNIGTNGFLGRSTSSIKYKKDISNLTHGLTEVLKLRPVTYKGKSEYDGTKVFGGLIAEEVHDAGLTEFVQYAEDGSPDSLSYGNMVSLAFKAIQELKAENNSLKSRIEALEAK